MQRKSERRLAENEVLFREKNKAVQDFMLSHDDDNHGVLHFYCECSMTSCVERIELSPEEYSSLHNDKRRFIAAAGHENLEIEHIVTRKDGFNVVEKFKEPPSPKVVT